MRTSARAVVNLGLLALTAFGLFVCYRTRVAAGAVACLPAYAKARTLVDTLRIDSRTAHGGRGPGVYTCGDLRLAGKLRR